MSDLNQDELVALTHTLCSAYTDRDCEDDAIFARTLAGIRSYFVNGVVYNDP